MWLPLYLPATSAHFEASMTRFAITGLTSLLICWAALGSVAAQPATNVPAFNEVYELVRGHLRGFGPAELDQAAVEGLLGVLSPRVSIVAGPATKPTNAVLLAAARVLEGNVAYLRVGCVGDGLAEAVARAQGELSRTSKIVGLALDLRYATGDDYAAAVAVAGLFAKSETDVLDWGAGLKKMHPASQPFSQPVAVLVNRQTAGAAEALAAVLRETGVALLLGQTTAGAAALMEDFPLKTGQFLRIATTPVKLASGAPLSPQGLKPDITVAVNGDDEKTYLADAYREPVRSTDTASAATSSENESAATNRTRRPRPSEADLVRARREGLPLDGDFQVARDAEPPRPVLRDPALARAVDLLKGLAVVRSAKP